LAVFLILEDTVVAMIVLDLGTRNVVQLLLKPFIAHDGLTGAKRYLILNLDEPRCGIIVDSPTIKLTTTLTIACGKPAGSPTNKLVCRHKIPYLQLVATYSSLSFEI
jgi:hypothetical protein